MAIGVCDCGKIKVAHDRGASKFRWVCYECRARTPNPCTKAPTEQAHREPSTVHFQFSRLGKSRA